MEELHGIIPYVGKPNFEEDGLKERLDYTSVSELTVEDILMIDESEEG
jgi:hypothetical protein